MFFKGLTLLCNIDMLHCFLPLIFPKRRLSATVLVLFPYIVHFLFALNFYSLSLNLLNRYIFIFFYFCLFKVYLPKVSKYTYVYTFAACSLIHTQKKKFSRYLCFLIKSTVLNISLSNCIHE